jgi:hypothetical protein
VTAPPLFPFARSVRPECCEWPEYSTLKAKLTGGFTERASEQGTDFILRAVFSMEFPQSSTGKTLTDLLAFIESVRGAALPFRYSAYTDRYRELRALAIGTGDGVTTDFALPRKHVNAATYVVYRDAAAADPAHSSIVANDDAPKIRFLAAPMLGVVLTADVDFYWPMHFEEDAVKPLLRAALGTDAKKSVRVDGVLLEQAQPGEGIIVLP